MEDRKKHEDFLREKIFQVDAKWPHFGVLIDDIAKIGKAVKPTDTVVILERSYVYGGDSLFAPLFDKCNLILVDCQIPTSNERAGYQASWVQSPDFIKITSQFRRPITDTGLESNSADWVLIPNVVHHERDQIGMFKEIGRILKPGGKGYIFEAILRELHQIPDDYVRYTPWGIEYMLEVGGLKMDSYETTGNVFEAITYCWDQALQYIPDGEMEELKTWFKEKHYKELIELDKKYPSNLKRKHTSFPVGYNIFFSK